MDFEFSEDLKFSQYQPSAVGRMKRRNEEAVQAIAES